MDSALRRCMPTWTICLDFLTVSTIFTLSSSVFESGFSRYTSLPAASAAKSMGAW
jgi:hypothetical protein